VSFKDNLMQKCGHLGVKQGVLGQKWGELRLFISLFLKDFRSVLGQI